MVDGGVVSFGNAEGNTVVLPARDVVPWHARVTVDARGAVLEIVDPGARAHVNARPVREKALLRSGDVLCLGKIAIALKADRDDEILTKVPAAGSGRATAAAQPPKVVLRGVSGSHFGKTIPVNQTLLIGRAPECGLVIDEPRVAPRHASLEHAGDAIYLRGVDASASLFVDGIRVRDAIVHPGDQLSLENHHFIVEAPGLPLRGEDRLRDAHAITQPLEPIDHGRLPSSHAHHAIWWLIGAATIIAGAIALLIWHGAQPG